jgi:dipeptidyl aminopeptidase/acylaminoacyl peptidase
MQVWSIDVADGKMALLGDGDTPAIAPVTHRVAYVRNGTLWIAPLDGSKPAEAVAARGIVRGLAWSPDGTRLAFESDRDDHAFITIWSGQDRPLRYIAPAMSLDSQPVWSPDGKRLAFVRQPGRAKAKKPDDFEPQPWTIWVADETGSSASQVWKSGGLLVDSLPAVKGSANLQWGAGDRLVFLSYKDGWPHLYAVPAAGGAEVLLTPGSFMVEDVAVSTDRKSIYYTANTGSDKDDRDRRHVFKVAVEAGPPTPITSGTGLEWGPVLAGDGKTLAYISSTAARPPVPAVASLDGRGARTIGDALVPSTFPTASLVTPELLTIKAADGSEVHAQIFKPKKNDGAPRPAVIFAHGGPAQQMLLGWHYVHYYANAYALNQYLASKGIVVLSVNYRLGIGYGHAFQFPQRAGALGASEYQDILVAGQYLAKQSDVDPKRIGIWGGSYGGFLTALALGRDSDLFSVGVDIHGVHDLVLRETELFITVTSESSGDESTAGSWRSPVLLIHADDDRNVPFHGTLELAQRAADNGVMVETKVVPDDVHDFLLFRSWQTVLGATAEFLERFFFTPRPPPPTTIPGLAPPEPPPTPPARPAAPARPTPPARSR